MNDDNNAEFEVVKEIPQRNNIDSESRSSLMNEIETMISKSVKKVFESKMQELLNNRSEKQNWVPQFSGSTHKPLNLNEQRNNIAGNGFEFPQQTKPQRTYVAAGPCDMFSDNSSFPNRMTTQNLQFENARNSFNRMYGTSAHHNYELNAANASATVDANASVSSNDLIMRMLQREFEERKERKFESDLNKIPEFSGDSKKNLDRFITAASIAYKKISNQEQSDSFYEEILRKTSGSALSTVERMTGSRWNEIESALRRRFSYLTVNSDVLRSKIESLRQNKNENISEFAKRARKLVNDRIKSYDCITVDLEHEIEKSALKCFQRGISNEKIRERVINMGACSLDRAFQNALEVEADMSFEINKRDFYCRYCLVPGHKTSNCRKNNDSDIGRLAVVLEKLVNDTEYFSSENDTNQIDGQYSQNENANGHSNNEQSEQQAWQSNGSENSE